MNGIRKDAELSHRKSFSGLMANPVEDTVGIMLVGRKLFDGLALGLGKT